MKNKIPVFVGAIGGGGHGEQIVKALRMAGPERYFIIGGDASPYCPQFYDVDVPVLLPKANHPAYLEAVFNICKKFDAVAVFHGCEAELRVFNDNRDLFKSHDILLPINSKDVLQICMDKKLTVDFLQKNDCYPPASVELKGKQSIDDIQIFPVIVKPCVGGGGSRDTYIAQSREQLHNLANFLDLENETFIAQEYVGNYENEFTVGVLHDLDGKFINSIALKRHINSALNMRYSVKNITDRSSLGQWLIVSSGVSHGVIDDFPEVRKQCQSIASALGSKGPLNIQCRFVDGRVRVFEINPRFSGTTSLRAMMGFNEPDILIRRHLFNEEISVNFKYKHGTIIRSLKETVLTNNQPESWRALI